MSSGHLVFGLLYWLVCAAVSAGVAAEKGRSAAGFFFLSLLFLGPLAVGVAVLAAPGVSSGSAAPQRVAATPSPIAATTPSPEAPLFRVGDRVRVASSEHRRFGKEGTVSSLLSTFYVNVKFGAFTEDVFSPEDLELV